MNPPWIILPHIPNRSTGWRMGQGEEVRTQFYRAFSDLTPEARDAYQAKHPEPEGWEGFYDTIRANPWPNSTD